MLFEINDGTVTVGGETVLRHIHFEIHGTEKIAVVGRNGAGKTTLLRLIAGELTPDRDDKRRGAGIYSSRSLSTEMLTQNVFDDIRQPVTSIIDRICSDFEPYSRERYACQQEFDRLLTGFGFSKADKHKKIEEFSGGERTKLGFIRLLLKKPDILLLDEPTNHLDTEAVQWLETYLQGYEKAVVMVSHDRFFLDQTAQVVYELSRGELCRYAGNYTAYREQKHKKLLSDMKAYERQQAEIARQKALIERFKHKPRKAAFARSRRKLIERMEAKPRPAEDESHIFTGDIVPDIPGSRWVYECEHLKPGYEQPLLELTWRIRRGQKIGLMGPNGSGKTTFLKTVAGLVEPLAGRQTLGKDITIGYFDQHSTEIDSVKTVAEHFGALFPAMPQKEVRQTLGAYLFGGARAARRVCDLSGGEKARLVLCELLTMRPNFLILDEPTNHMDIPARETLESAFRAYKGTILFVSHDRYFLSRVAEELLIFDHGQARYYPFGYGHYISRSRQGGSPEELRAGMDAHQAALVAGLKAVPRPERHRLREIDTGEAYDQWRLRLAREAMEEAAAQARQAWEQWQEQRMLREMSGEIFLENGDAIKEALRPYEMRYEAAADRWQETCCQWYEIWEQLYGGNYESDTNT